MRRSPLYPYSTFPHGFYGPPAQDAAYFGHRPYPSSPALPTPNTRSVINIPVFASAPPCPSSSPPQKHSNSSPPPSPAVPLIDSSTAATKIQSHFRGFNVRRHRPLFHLRSIAKARKQLESLQSELENPAFPLKVKTNEKELLRFSESVMAVILSLDAIEGSMEEVRSQRKEATKMAIKLQDAMDAIILQRGENATLQPTDGPLSAGVMTPEEDSVMCDQPNGKMVQGVCTTSEESIMDANRILQESTSLEESVSDKCLSNANNKEIVGNIVPPLLPIKVENDDQLVEAGMSMPCSSEAVSKHVEVMHNSEQDMTSEIMKMVTEDNCPGDSKGAPTLPRGKVEGCIDVAYENANGVAKSGDEAKKQSSTLTMLETSSSPDSALLLQLSEDCKQLRSLVGKLLVQNKAQSKVMCALGERLELLEQQQQLNTQQRMCQKRKLGKGSKRRGKCCKWE